MKNQRVGRRYALALMSVADEQKAVEKVARDLAAVSSLIRESREFELFVDSPVLTAAKKSSVFKAILGSVVGKEVLTFVLLLTRKGREPLIPDIADQFALLMNERLGIVDVSVGTAVTLTDDQKELLRTQLERRTARKVRLHETVDKELVGGLRIQIGDTVHDGSVRRQLQLLKDRFVSGGTLS